MYNDIKVDYSPQLRGGRSYIKSDPLWGVYCPEAKTITYNPNNITLAKGIKVRIKEFYSIRYYICEVIDDSSLRVLEVEDSIPPFIYRSIFDNILIEKEKP